MKRRLLPWKPQKTKQKQRNAIVIPVPGREDAKTVGNWTVVTLEDWMDKLANRVFYAYTTVKLLVLATKEKSDNKHIDKHGRSLLGISELLVKVTWGWNEGIRGLKGFSRTWLKIDVDEEIQDSLLRAQPLLDAMEASTSRLLHASSSWEIFISFCIWAKDVCIFIFFVVVEILHAFLHLAVSILDLILDLLLDSEKRKETYTLLIDFLKWLHTRYFEAGSVLTKSVFSALKKIAPHFLVYLGGPYAYLIQAIAVIIKRLAKIAADNNEESLPKPLRLSAKAARKILLQFRSLAFAIWKPLVTNMFSEKEVLTPLAKL
jgi:hypothetical protein